MGAAHLLADLERLLAEGLRVDARRAGLPESTARVLLALEAGEEVPMSELAARIGRSPSTATRFADRATAAGLLRRETGLDRRRRLATLTADGETARERLLRRCSQRAEALPRAVQRRTGLGAAEVEWFLASLVQALRSDESKW